MSKVNTATSISAMIVRSSAVASKAPSRCVRSVSPSALISSSTSPERVIDPRAAGPDRVIAFAQSGEQVRHRLQRPDDVFARVDHEAEAAADDHQRQRPLHLGRVIAKPEQRERDHGGRRGGADDEPGEMAFVRKPVPRFLRADVRGSFIRGAAAL